MNKLPTKQIYLLTIIVVGIFVLSIYSTYSIFTLESETDNIVSMNTPISINLPTKIYEYKQVLVPKNSYIKTDVDLYNNMDTDSCYSIWYKVVSSSSVDKNKIKIYENTTDTITTSGTINTMNSKRVNLFIINDNDVDTKINIGLSYQKDEETCSLNITSDRQLITSSISNPKPLSDTLIKSLEVNNNSEGYLTYKNNIDKISIPYDTKIFISTDFTYENELFTLKNANEIEYENIINYVSNENTNYYTCLTTDKCTNLYKINSFQEEIVEEKKYISITKYDVLKGYLSGKSGLKKTNNNYLYFGDNPHNFIYYNCQNELDTNSCELWRIMGFYYDEQTKTYLPKIISDSQIAPHTYSNDNNLWPTSEIADYLNKEYKLINNNLLMEATYNQETIITDENNTSIISHLPDKNKSYITIMNLSDYLNASLCEKQNIFDYDSACLNNNWLNKNNDLFEYTMTIKYEMPTLDADTGELTTPENNIAYSVGSSLAETKITEKMYIRPVIYLKPRTIFISGNGTIDNPYIIK